jgi:hypothetical protein
MCPAGMNEYESMRESLVASLDESQTPLAHPAEEDDAYVEFLRFVTRMQMRMQGLTDGAHPTAPAPPSVPAH